MWIQQPGSAYGPGGKGRVGRNGGAANGWSLAPQSGYSQVHSSPPGFERTVMPGPPARRQGPQSGPLHQLAKTVNLASAIARARALSAQRNPQRQAAVGVPIRARAPMPVGPGLDRVDPMVAIAANFRQAGTLAPTVGPPIADPTAGMADPYAPGGYGTPNTAGIDDYIQQQLLAQRQAMVARLMATGRIQ